MKSSIFDILSFPGNPPPSHCCRSIFPIFFLLMLFFPLAFWRFYIYPYFGCAKTATERETMWGVKFTGGLNKNCSTGSLWQFRPDIKIFCKTSFGLLNKLPSTHSKRNNQSWISKTSLKSHFECSINALFTNCSEWTFCHWIIDDF